MRSKWLLILLAAGVAFSCVRMGPDRQTSLRYNLEFTVAQEYFAFNFDSTQAYLKHCQQLARRR